MIKIATTIPKIAVPSASAQPSNSAFVIFPSASGCLATASTAFDVARPIPSPAPSPTNAAIPAPIANNPFISFSPSYFHF
jgi:hypothetical protein